MDKLEAKLLKEIADLDSLPAGAYNIRKNGGAGGRNNTAHIVIDTKTDKSGIDIHIAPGTKHESVHIPVIITETGLTELVYNDFYIGEDCDVDIVAGCGIHNGGCDTSQHDGVHTFHVGKNAKVRYYEKHYGEGELTITPECLNPRGAVHGGCLATLANAVSGWVAGAVQHCNSATASYTLNFLRPAMGTNQKIRCRATPEKTGRTLSVYHVSLTDDEGLEVATGNFTFFMMDKRLNGTTPERLERTADES